MIEGHYIGRKYYVQGSKGEWTLEYYPLNECGKTGKVYDEPRALMQKVIKGGFDLREMPLRYIEPKEKWIH